MNGLFNEIYNTNNFTNLRFIQVNSTETISSDGFVAICKFIKIKKNFS